MILVTSIANKIGQSIAHQLLEQGLEVKVFIRNKEELSVIPSKNLSFSEVNILDVTEVYENIEGVDTVIHCDVIDESTSVSYEKRMKYNVEGTANIVNALLHHGGKKIIFLSSIHTLGADPEKIVTEETKSEKNEWTTEQALSLMLAEREIWRGNVEGLDVNIVHSAPFLDKGLSENHLLQTAQNALQKGTVEIFPAPVHYVGIDDVATLTVRLSQMEKWNQRWIAIAESLPPQQFYTFLGQHFSYKWKMKKMESSSVYFKVLGDFLQSVIRNKERSFRRANARRNMTSFKYDNFITSQTFSIQWKKLEDLLK